MNDLRFAFRQLLKNPGFTAVAVVTLALGIGANTAVFSVVNAVLLRPLPYREPARLVMLCESKPAAGTAQSVVSTTAFAEWRKRCRSVEQAAAVRFDNFVLGGAGGPERLLLCQASADYFPLLGLKPVLGRTFLPEEERDGEGYGRVVVLGHALWRRRFAADPSIVGKAIELNGLPHTVVGVMGPEAGRFFHPKDLAGWPAGLGEPELWRPLPVDWALRVSPNVRWLLVLGRLADGATAAQATAELDAISADLARANPAQYAGWGATAVPLHEQVVRGSRGPLLVLAAATAAVLLMACANVANLMLVASARRGAEFAVRAALGAGRGALVRQVLVEAMLLALVGGGVGVLAAAWAVGAIASHAPADLPRARDATLDAAALCFALGATVLTGLLFGLVPALRAHDGNLNLALTAAGRGAGAGRAARRQARLLVMTEVALALPLLLCTGLLARSLVRLLDVDPGFRPQQVLVADVSLLHRDYREVSPRIQFVERVLDRVHALPGVTSA